MYTYMYVYIYIHVYMYAPKYTYLHMDIPDDHESPVTTWWSDKRAFFVLEENYIANNCKGAVQCYVKNLKGKWFV